MEVAEEENTREGGKFYHVSDGWHYHMNRKTDDGKIYYKCIYYEKGCGGRAALDDGGFRHTKPHTTHAVDFLYPDEMALRRAILARCRSLEYVSYRTILDQESLRFPIDVVARVTMGRMRTPMRLARLHMYPPPPANLRALTAILMDPANAVLTMTKDGRDNLYAGSVTDEEGGHHIVFASRRQLRRLRQARTIHGDGTFKTIPVNKDFAAQVFVICFTWQNHIIYLGWVLMESRTQVAYSAVFRFLIHCMGPNQPRALQLVITDFEIGQQNAWEIEFGVTIQGCLWHFCRAILHAVADHGLIALMRGFVEIRNVIQLSMALPLLPERLMKMGYRVVVAYTRVQGNLVIRRLRPYLRYLGAQWIQRDWMRERLCVYRSLERTNNASESSNRALRDEVGTHPGVYHLISGLITLEQRAHFNYATLAVGNLPGRARKAVSVMNDNRIRNLCNDLERAPGPIFLAVFRFLKAAAHLMDNMVDEALIDRRQR